MINDCSCKQKWGYVFRCYVIRRWKAFRAGKGNSNFLMQSEFSLIQPKILNIHKLNDSSHTKITEQDNLNETKNYHQFIFETLFCDCRIAKKIEENLLSRIFVSLLNMTFCRQDKISQETNLWLLFLHTVLFSTLVFRIFLCRANIHFFVQIILLFQR